MDSHRIHSLGIVIAAIATVILALGIALPAGDGACAVLERVWPTLNWLSSAVPLQPVALLAHGC